MGWIRTAAVFGFLAVALGAFGAHALRERLPERMLAAYNTGVLYQLVHAVALFALALYARATSAQITLPASLFALGMVLFSGSLYLMAVSGWTRLGIVTPFGGLAMLGGWGTLIWAIR
jgi:uncharacterized membrane protein YgdD (TMEM256/DUF423 family)